MAEDALASEQWIAKTQHPVGVDLSLPPPELRYQFLQGRVFTLQFFPNGEIARGEVQPSVLAFSLDSEGWYNWDGSFLGDDPQVPEWD